MTAAWRCAWQEKGIPHGIDHDSEEEAMQTADQVAAAGWTRCRLPHRGHTMNKSERCRDIGVQIFGAAVFHHPRCGHVVGNNFLHPPNPHAALAMCCFERWMEDE